tara:strand:+ start:92 stop:424 length:333 start_codon:yes stop_codon:yes gene_type:complete
MGLIMWDFIESFYITLNSVLPSWYIFIGVAYGLFMMGRALIHDFEMVALLVIRVFWTTLILPAILALLWPLSITLHIAKQIWGLHHNRFFQQLYGGYWDKDEEHFNRKEP